MKLDLAADKQVCISQKTNRMIQLNKRIQTRVIQVYYTADKAVTPRHTHVNTCNNKKKMLATFFELQRLPVAEQEPL